MQLFFLLPGVLVGWTVMVGLTWAVRRFTIFIYGTARMHFELHINVHGQQHTTCMTLRSSLTFEPES